MGWFSLLYFSKTTAAARLHALPGGSMQTAQDNSINPQHVKPGSAQADNGAADIAARGDYRIIRRNGSVVAFEPNKISVAMTKAFLAIAGGQGAVSARIRE